MLQCQGDLAFAEGTYAEAERLYREGLALHSAHQSMWLDLGRIVFDAGRIEEAEEIFRKAVEDDERPSLALADVERAIRVASKTQGAGAAS